MSAATVAPKKRTARRFTVRLTERQYAYLREVAQHYDVSIAKALRMAVVILAEDAKQGIYPNPGTGKL